MEYNIPMSQSDQIIQQIESLLHIKVISTNIPKQGMDSEVFIIKDSNQIEYAVKYSTDAFTDAIALELISKENINLPVPKVFGHFEFDGKTVLILEKINSTLLDDTPVEDRHNYIKSMIDNLKILHQVKSDIPGLISGRFKQSTWKEFLLSKYTGNHEWYPWEEIANREGVDTKLILRSVEKIKELIAQIELPNGDYSLLHTDFNQRNLFVDPTTYKITAIIDWSEAMFGDSLYDFARVRMHIIHFNLGDKALNTYWSELNLETEDKEREELYLTMQILDYITWYSEELNEFNVGRIKLHQEYLRKVFN